MTRRILQAVLNQIDRRITEFANITAPTWEDEADQ